MASGRWPAAAPRPVAAQCTNIAAFHRVQPLDNGRDSLLKTSLQRALVTRRPAAALYGFGRARPLFVYHATH